MTESDLLHYATARIHYWEAMAQLAENVPGAMVDVGDTHERMCKACDALRCKDLVDADKLVFNAYLRGA